jgi:hypothetical protein
MVVEAGVDGIEHGKGEIDLSSEGGRRIVARAGHGWRCLGVGL